MALLVGYTKVLSTVDAIKDTLGAMNVTHVNPLTDPAALHQF
jgi:hypothetical protein